MDSPEITTEEAMLAVLAAERTLTEVAYREHKQGRSANDLAEAVAPVMSRPVLREHLKSHAVLEKAQAAIKEANAEGVLEVWHEADGGGPREVRLMVKAHTEGREALPKVVAALEAMAERGIVANMPHYAEKLLKWENDAAAQSFAEAFSLGSLGSGAAAWLSTAIGLNTGVDCTLGDAFETAEERAANAEGKAQPRPPKKVKVTGDALAESLWLETLRVVKNRRRFTWIQLTTGVTHVDLSGDELTLHFQLETSRRDFVHSGGLAMFSQAADESANRPISVTVYTGD